MYVSISHPHTHHAVARGLITYSTHYSGAFYCHNRLFYLTLLSLVDSLFSLSLSYLSLSHKHTHTEQRWSCWYLYKAYCSWIHVWILHKKYCMHVAFWFHQYKWLLFVATVIVEVTAMGGGGGKTMCVGGGALRERSSARRCNSSWRLGCAFLSKVGNTCSPLIRQV